MINETHVILGLLVGVSMVGVLMIGVAALWKIRSMIAVGFHEHLKIMREIADNAKPKE